MQTDPQKQPQIENRQAQVRQVLLLTLILNVAVSGGKIIIGAATGALSITADGFHSLMDGSSNLLGLIANRIAGQPADEDHPYGHRRFETLAAMAVGVLLLLTAFEIISGAVERLTNPQAPEINSLTFAVLIGTLITNLFVSTYERRAGQRLQSELLIADAANSGSDVYVTISVLVSMVLVSFGLTWADPLAAVLIVILIGRAAFKILRQTGGVLVDTAPYKSAALAALAEQTPGVQRVIRARSRGTADAALIDIDVQVHPSMTAGQTAAIADSIRERIETTLAGVQEVEVHFAPHDEASPDYALAARARADALGLSTHEVRVSETPEGKVLEMHVEVPAGLTLEDAHAQVSQLENVIRASEPEIADVVTHIEPRAVEPNEGKTSRDSLAAKDLCERALHLLHWMFPAANWHALRAVGSSEDGYTLTLHAALDPSMTVEQAHTLAEEAETLLKANYPLLTRVTIHTEPPDEGEHSNIGS
ncbi:MAG: cation-efflux pump [Anaerolineae bacterium]